MASPQVFILFCEDVREEVGNKISLMGLFGPKVVLPEPMDKIKNVSVVALCRFFTREPIDARFEITFIHRDQDKPQAAPPEPISLRLEPPGDESVWTNHIIGNLQGLPIHNGMTIESTLSLPDQQVTAALTIEKQKD